MTNHQQWRLRIPATISLYGLSGTPKARRDATYTGHGKRAAFLTVSLLLSACGGGGGGAIATPAPTPIEFTTWRTDLVGKMIKADGVGKQARYSWDGTIRDIEPAVDTAASATYLFDESGNLGGLIIETTPANSTRTSIGFATNQISDLTGYDGNLDSAGNAFFLKARNLPNQAVVSNPKSLGWDFQSFGMWETGLNSTDRTVGVFSVGNATGKVVQTTGTATFEGKVVGSYIDAAGKGNTVLAGLTVTANFDSLSLSLQTFNTRISPNVWADQAFGNELTDLNLSGKLDIAANGTFKGTLATNSGLTGESTGQFYGPEAQELGGVFVLPAAGTSVETYSGAYGASRLP